MLPKNEAGTYTVSPSQYDSMDSLAKPASSPTIEEALLSASHMYYDSSNETKPTDQEAEKTSVISGFNTISKKQQQQRRKSSFLNQPAATVFSSCTNLCNTVIGAGILTLPEAMTHLGWFLGFILLIFFAILAQITLHLAMMAAHTLKINENNIRVSYLTMCEATVPKLKYLVDFAVGITCFGVTCAYLVVIGDYMPDVAEQIINRSHGVDSTAIEDVLESRQFWLVIFLIVFIIPTARLKKMDSLRFTSTAAIVCFTYATIIVILYAFISALDPCDESDPDRFDEFCRNNEKEFVPIHNASDALKFFKAAPAIIFAYTCHQNAFSVTNELQVASKSNLNKVVFGTGTFCMCVYMVVAACGYYSFGVSAPSNLLTAYPKTIPILIVRICLSLAIAFSYPVLAHPARNSFSSLIFGVADAKELHWIKYNIITWTIVLLSFVIAMATDDLGIVISVVGSTGTTTIAFILPGLFYYYLPIEMLKLNQRSSYKYKRYVALAMTIFGIILIPFGLAMIFVD